MIGHGDIFEIYDCKIWPERADSDFTLYLIFFGSQKVKIKNLHKFGQMTLYEL